MTIPSSPFDTLATVEEAFRKTRAANAALRTTANLSMWTLWDAGATQVIVDLDNALRFGSVRGAIWSNPDRMVALRTATQWERKGNGPLQVLRLGEGLEANLRHLDSMLEVLAERRRALEDDAADIL